jgi:tRNA1Val (adenine37-N6)-methyltransferase
LFLCINIDKVEKGAFRFKQFDIKQDGVAMKVNTDGILLGAWAHVEDKHSALDIGTGTGIIAMMLAQRNPQLYAVGIDIDQDSAAICAINMNNAPFADRLLSYQSSIQDFAQRDDTKYDLIVSNPPFFSGGTFSINENKNNVRHTVKLSHSDLLFSVKKLLNHGGHFDVVLPYIEGLRFIELALQYDLYLHHVTEIIPRVGKPIERLLISLSDIKSEAPLSDQLVVYADLTSISYSPSFIALTHEFYLHMELNALD